MFFFIIRKNILEIQVSLFSRKDFICIFIALLRDNKLERHINKKVGFFVFINEKKTWEKMEAAEWLSAEDVTSQLRVRVRRHLLWSQRRQTGCQTYLSYGRHVSTNFELRHKESTGCGGNSSNQWNHFICKINLSWSAKQACRFVVVYFSTVHFHLSRPRQQQLTHVPMATVPASQTLSCSAASCRC